jgi:hypothetical protein
VAISSELDLICADVGTLPGLDVGFIGARPARGKVSGGVFEVCKSWPCRAVESCRVQWRLAAMDTATPRLDDDVRAAAVEYCSMTDPTPADRRAARVRRPSD